MTKKFNSSEDFSYHLTRYFTVYLTNERGISMNTIMSYRDTFVLLLRYFQTVEKIRPENLTLSQITKEKIETFLTWLETEKNSSQSTRNNRLVVIRAFYKYLLTEVPENFYNAQRIVKMKPKKQPEMLINYLTLQGIKSLLSQPDATTKKGYRDLTLLTLMYDTGARVQELADLTVRDVRTTIPATVKLTGKGSKSRLVPLLGQPTVYLKKYLEIYKLTNPDKIDSPLFFGTNNTKLTRAGISYILKKYADMARAKTPNEIPDKVTPHCLRHSKAMHLLESGTNIVYIRDLLGHSSSTVTEIYARANEDLKRKALDTLNNDTENQVISWHQDSNMMNWLLDLGK